MSARGSTPSGIWPRNMRSRQPGTMIGSNVGLGMKRNSLPPTSRSVCVPCCTTCTPALAELLGRGAGCTRRASRSSGCRRRRRGIRGPSASPFVRCSRCHAPQLRENYNVSTARDHGPGVGEGCPVTVSASRASNLEAVVGDGQDHTIARSHDPVRSRDRARSPSRSPTSCDRRSSSGELAEGESLGREPDLVERFGVSRPIAARSVSASSRPRGSSPSCAAYSAEWSPRARRAHDRSHRSARAAVAQRDPR